MRMPNVQEIEVLRAMLAVLALTQQHRALSSAVLRGVAQLESNRAAAQAQAEKAWTDIGTLIQQHGDQARLHARWERLLGEWKALTQEVTERTLSVAESFERHTALVQGLIEINDALAACRLGIDRPVDQRTVVKRPHVALLRSSDRQRGAALVVGLMFLVILSLLGTTAYSTAKQQERMSGNSRDRIRAFEAAEAALRDCESVVASVNALPPFNGTGGLYRAGALGSKPKVDEIDWSNTGATRVLLAPLADVAQQPRCIVEELEVKDDKTEDDAQSMPQETAAMTVYRATALGYGSNLNTTAIVQSTYRRRP